MQWEIPGLKINGLPYVSQTIETIASGASDSTIIDLTNADWDLRGKNLDSNSSMYSTKQTNVLIILLMTLIAILLKGLIVYLLYNFMAPKIIYSLSENKTLEIIESNFKPISFSESVLLVILTNTLFHF